MNQYIITQAKIGLENIFENMGLGKFKVQVYQSASTFSEDLEIALTYKLTRFDKPSDLMEGLSGVMIDIKQSPMIQNQVLSPMYDKIEKLEFELNELKQYKAHYEMEYKLKHGMDSVPEKPNATT